MKKIPIIPDLSRIPSLFHPLLKDTPVYDSSCSPEAKVCFIDRDGGFYLKTAPKGTLKTEADMTRFFNSKGLAADVLAYLSDEQDWLLTKRIPGEDCTHAMYLEDPKRLCDTTAELLWNLHHTDPSGCPVADHTKHYLERIDRNHQMGHYDHSFLPENYGISSAAKAWEIVKRDGPYLQSDTLLHGDYCLPNIMLDNWCFSGFIDLAYAGIGDRHVDLFWGTWTLFFNLKTNRYHKRFLDAYGRSEVEPEMLRLIAACEAFG